jgi:hypothetical protein
MSHTQLAGGNVFEEAAKKLPKKNQSVVAFFLVTCILGLEQFLNHVVRRDASHQ